MVRENGKGVGCLLKEAGPIFRQSRLFSPLRVRARVFPSAISATFQNMSSFVKHHSTP